MFTAEKTAARKSLPLTERDLHDLKVLTGSQARRSALFALVGVAVPETASVSESQVLHAVWEAGLRAVEALIEEKSYAAEAAERAQTNADQLASARRRRPDWADEE